MDIDPNDAILALQNHELIMPELIMKQIDRVAQNALDDDISEVVRNKDKEVFYQYKLYCIIRYKTF